VILKLVLAIVVTMPPTKVVVIEVVIGLTRAQVRFTLSSSNVTAPVCARARPFKVAPVFKVMLVRARIFPVN